MEGGKDRKGAGHEIQKTIPDMPHVEMFSFFTEAFMESHYVSSEVIN